MYSEIQNKFTPLDLLFFRGTEILSNTISVLEAKMNGNGDFSHVGVLINSELIPTVPQLKPGRWYVWESTISSTSVLIENLTDGAVNVENGRGTIGVQIRDLEEVIGYYTKDGGKVAWGQLLNNPWTQTQDFPKQREDLIKRVCVVHKLVGTRTYDFNILALLASIFPCLRKPRDVFNEIMINGYSLLVSWKLPSNDVKADTSPTPAGWLFCSELVAIIYQRVGVLAADVNPQNVVPIDFLGYDQDGKSGISKITQDPVYLKP